MKFIVFQIQEHRCALRTEEVFELLPMAKLWKTAEMPHSLEGLLNLSGKLIPIFRLDRLFKVKEIALGLYTPILLVKSETGPLGLIIGKATGIHEVDPKTIVPVKNSLIASDCVDSEFIINDEKISLISVNKLLMKEEIQRAKEFETLLVSQAQQEELLKNIAA